ncbi:CRAL-TRIO domain-containing protein [Mycena floridula]|nr:CRAL-TRIO domain-containing protein [Mycena floridula]
MSAIPEQPTDAATVKSEPEAVTTEPAATTESDSEPQNELTKKFTEAEWKALKEFRASLPKVFSDAGLTVNAINLWGVNIDPAGKLDAKASVILMKFLRARNLNASEAHVMMVATLRWREEFNVEAAKKEEFPAEIFGSLGHVYGRDKVGHPVVYNVFGGKDVTLIFSDVPRFLRWRVALMERAISQLDFETVDQTVEIHDYDGMGFSTRDANAKNAATEASSIFGSHYPEFLNKKFFVNVSWVYTWVFGLFKMILPSATMKKMTMVSQGRAAIGRALLPLIDASQLPKQYGGEADAFT